MRRFSLIAYIVLFTFVMPVFAQKEPVAARKPLRFWVERLSHKDPKVRERAAEFLISEPALKGVPGLGDLDSKARNQLDAFRKEAKPLIPELLEVMRSTDETVVNTDVERNIVVAAATILTNLGPEARSASPELERIVLDKRTSKITRMYGIYALLFVTPEEKPVGPILLKLLNSVPKETLHKVFIGNQDTTKNDKGKQSVDFQVAASIDSSVFKYMTFLAVSGHTKSEVPSLVKIASGNYPRSIRLQAINALRTLAFDAKASVPALRKLLKDDDRFIGNCAVFSLILIDPDPKHMTVIVESLKLKGKEREEYEKGIREFIKLQEQGRKELRETDVDQDELAEFVQMLKYGNGFYRRFAIYYFGQIGPNAKSVVPELRKLLKDPDEDTRRMASEALKQIESEVVKSNGK